MYQKFQEKAGGCDQTWRWCGTVSWIFEGAGEDRIKKDGLTFGCCSLLWNFSWRKSSTNSDMYLV